MRRPLLLLCTLLALAACGSPRRADVASPRNVPALTVTSSNFSDHKPVDWDGRPPTAYAVHGVDISRYQQWIDWPTARANGVNFAFIKATEGGDMVDPMFQTHWRGAAEAGVLPGAYHFYYHCRPAIEQARWFIRHVPRVKGALPPVLDMEWTPFSPTCPQRPDPAEVRRNAAIFMNALTEHYGQVPILYTTPDFYEANEMWRVSGQEFWLRSTARHPQDRYADQHWTFWQYTGTGDVPGIVGKVDVNVFAGTPAAWRDWAGRRLQ
jgi:lysozyme